MSLALVRCSFPMSFDVKMMQRCIQLAQLGLGTTYPNPMVGAVLVHEGKIISEGWHRKAGEPHAEVNALIGISDPEILQNSTLYVSLEPCAHYGKTPPCADLIIEKKIPHVVVGTTDPFSQVNGQGIEKMKQAGIQVEVGVLEKECRDLNRRFFWFHQYKRPYVILKWAQTADGFMAPRDSQQKWISNSYSQQLVHKWRTEEQAILVGTQTARVDNPQLINRSWEGNSPVRIVLDKELKLPANLNLLDQSHPTLVFTEIEKEGGENLKFIQVNFDENLAELILHKLHEENIQSVIIEGGKKTLELFIEKELWDEARIFTSTLNWRDGLSSPKLRGELKETINVGSDRLDIYRR